MSQEADWKLKDAEDKVEKNNNEELEAELIDEAEQISATDVRLALSEDKEGVFGNIEDGDEGVLHQRIENLCLKIEEKQNVLRIKREELRK